MVSGYVAWPLEDAGNTVACIGPGLTGEGVYKYPEPLAIWRVGGGDCKHYLLLALISLMGLSLPSLSNEQAEKLENDLKEIGMHT